MIGARSILMWQVVIEEGEIDIFLMEVAILEGAGAVRMMKAFVLNWGSAILSVILAFLIGCWPDFVCFCAAVKD